jgi:hypothetical protein
MARPIKPRPIEVPIGPSIAYVPLTKELYALIDRDDVDAVSNYRWTAQFSKNTRSFYARTFAKIKGNTSTRLHRYLLDSPESFVDHRNRNTLDCRRSNLRHASWSQSVWNRGVQRNSRSQIKGAQWSKRDGRYYSYIAANGIRRWLGSFATAEEAGNAYAKAATELHGEFSCAGGVTSKA